MKKMTWPSWPSWQSSGSWSRWSRWSSKKLIWESWENWESNPRKTAGKERRFSKFSTFSCKKIIWWKRQNHKKYDYFFRETRDEREFAKRWFEGALPFEKSPKTSIRGCKLVILGIFLLINLLFTKKSRIFAGIFLI